MNQIATLSNVATQASFESRAGQIHRGLGVVVRWDDVVMVIPSDTAHDAAVDRMLNDLGPRPSPNALMKTVTGLLDSDRLKAVALLVRDRDTSFSAVVRGQVEVLVDTKVVLSGGPGASRHELEITTERITLRAANLAKAAEPVAPYDLRLGVAPGAGLTLLEVTEPADSAPSVPAGSDDKVANSPTSQGIDSVDTPDPVSSQTGPGELPVAEPLPEKQSEKRPEMRMKAETPSDTGATPAATSIPLIGPSFAASDPLPFLAPLPLPAEQDTTMDLPGSTSGHKLEGILCARSHFNNPANSNCMVCGLSLEHLSNERVRGPRPTLGFIVFDDGATFGLDRSYVIGREPQQSSEIEAEGLVIRSDNETLSRTHAELRLVGWQVQLVDRGSTNGTYIWNSLTQEWIKLTLDTPVELHSGATVALGRRTFVFEMIGH